MNWAVPLGQIRGTSVSLSYTVLGAATVLIAAVAINAGGQGNSDLFTATLVGVLFWTGGWLIQAVTTSLYCLLAGTRLHTVVMGWIGVELTPYGWTAPRALGLSVACLGSLAGCGIAVWLAGVEPVAAAAEGQAPTFWQAPSLGMTSSDSLWRAGAWLLWIQALCQTCPLPRTLGRLGLVSAVSIGSRSASAPQQARVVRRSLFFAAFVITLLAISLVRFETSLAIPRWPLLLLLALLLAVSARAADVHELLENFQEAHVFPSDGQMSDSVVAKLRRRLMDRRNRRRLAAAVQREREEAVDAARLDDILQRLHTDGLESLSASDRAVLRRVSDTLRKYRQRGGPSE